MDFEIFQNLINQNKTQTEDGVVARFYDRIIKTGKFNDDGLPVFKTVCYCEIKIKDNTTEVFDQPATSDKIERFPVEYARYQMSRKQVQKGTPLEQFAFLTAAEIESCKYRGIFTIEALCNMSEEQAKSLGLSKERIVGRQFIEHSRAAKKELDIEKLRQDYEEKMTALKNEIASLKKSIKRRKNK